MAEVKIFKHVVTSGIRFRNFAGKEGKYNAEGDRNFCLLLDPDDAYDMAEEGWNVRYLKPKDPDESPVPYIQIKVGFGGKGRPPKVVMITKHGKTQLNEETINILDWADIEYADIAVNPYHYNVGDKKGIKAYLKTMYVTIAEDEFEDMYYDIPDSAQNIVDIEE